MTDLSVRIAFDVLKAVESEGAFSNILLNRKLQTAEGADAAFVRRLVHGVLKNRTLLDSQIDRYLRKGSIKLPARILLRMGFYQLAFCENVPEYAVVSGTVALAKKAFRGGEGFINAVLRSFVRDGRKMTLPEDLSVRYSMPAWIVRLWTDSYGEEKTRQLLEASLEEAPLCLRVNPLKTKAGYLPDVSGGIAASEGYRSGLFSVQDASSQEAIRILDPRPGERVLDVCSAPGGKTCAMAERMEDRGSIRACDLHENKLPLIEKEAKRLGIFIVETCVRDGCEAPKAEEIEAFDAVLCDVPCSGLGVLRRKPEIKWRLTEEELRSLPETQQRILKNAAACVRKGGRLLYSTCTVDPLENERVTEAFLRDGTFEKICERQIFTGETINNSKGDGFYVCLMRKKDL